MIEVFRFAMKLVSKSMHEWQNVGAFPYKAFEKADFNTFFSEFQCKNDIFEEELN